MCTTLESLDTFGWNVPPGQGSNSLPPRAQTTVNTHGLPEGGGGGGKFKFWLDWHITIMLSFTYWMFGRC